MKPSQRKIVILFVGFLVLLGIIIARLFQVQILKHDKYAAIAAEQQVFLTKIPAQRGTIYDRYMRPLAMSLPAYQVFADPEMISDAKKAAVVLADFGLGDLKSLYAKLTKDARFVWLDRRLDLESSLQLRKELDDRKLSAVYFEPTGERTLPLDNVALNVLGHVSIDDEPLGGIEQTMDDYLRGRQGIRRFFRDALGAKRPCVEAIVSTPESGNSVVLTIDSDLQEVAERELDQAVEEHKAKGGCVIIVDPRCGDILALASNPRETDFPVRQVFEPGSAFKICTISTALDLGRVDTTMMFDTFGGCLPVGGGKFIRDDHPGGVMDLREGVRRSSNVVAALVARRIGKRDFYRYMHAFGFGLKTGVGLEGESRGLLKEPDQWSGRSLETMGMGQEIGVTAMQMAMAYSAVANGGTLYQPRLVKAIIDENGNVMKAWAPRAVRTVVKKDTCVKMARMLRRVVESGTGTQAKIKGVEIAGKTGTGQKALGGVYVSGKYTAVFGGFLPVEKPTMMCIVVIDEPMANGYYGGVVSAPVFKNIVEFALRRDRNVVPAQCYNPKPVEQKQVVAKAVQDRHHKGNADEEAQPEPKTGVYPSVVGLTLRDAADVLAKSNIKWRAFGSGVVLEQKPEPLSPLDEAKLCSLVLGTTE
ncbi:MAG TPA: penicillin-binding transpeptidase domain-containing protein [bacterium]|nr:penicillin-binding transpeptidase domain-containing protein [bacterium]